MAEDNLSDTELQGQIREIIEASARRVTSRQQRKLRWNRLRLWLARRRIHRLWRKPFHLYDTACFVALKAGSDFNDRHRPSAAEANDAVFEALTRIHARSCSIAAEVSHLMRGGFASGAYARWRTIHESAVVACLITEADASLAERYLDHQFIASLKSAKLQEEHGEAIGLGPFNADDQQNLLALEKLYDGLINKYGPAFRHEYGWAAEHLHIKKPNLVDLATAVNMERWRPYYHLASHGVHAGPKGVLWSLAQSKHTEALVAGVSNRGFTYPADQSLISLSIVTGSLFRQRPEDLEAVVSMQSLNELVKLVGQEFAKVERALESGDRVTITKP